MSSLQKCHHIFSCRHAFHQAKRKNPLIFIVNEVACKVWSSHLALSVLFITCSPDQECKWGRKAAPPRGGQTPLGCLTYTSCRWWCSASITGIPSLMVKGCAAECIQAWMCVYPGGELCIYLCQGREFFLGQREEIVTWQVSYRWCETAERRYEKSREE